jgi:hypothetical protein
MDQCPFVGHRMIVPGFSTLIHCLLAMKHRFNHADLVTNVSHFLEETCFFLQVEVKGAMTVRIEGQEKIVMAIRNVIRLVSIRRERRHC